jgi:hypothetical protein
VKGKEMAELIFFVDLTVFAMVIACAVPLLRGDAKRRVDFPHSNVVNAGMKPGETSGELSMSVPGEREKALSAVFLMLPHLGCGVGQTKSAGIRHGRPQ